MPALGDGVYNILLALVFEKDGCEKLPILMESCRGPASECSLQYPALSCQDHVEARRWREFVEAEAANTEEAI